MRLCNPSRNREAQSNAAKLSRPRLIGTVEALEDVRQVVCSNADSGIPKLCHDGATASSHPDGDCSSWRGVLYGVVDENEEKAMQSVRIAFDEYLLRSNIFRKRQLLCLGQYPAVLACISEGFSQVYRSVLQSLDSCIGTRQQHQLLH